MAGFCYGSGVRRSVTTPELQISARLLQPFVRLLARRREIPPTDVNDLRSFSLDDRVPVTLAYALLDDAVRRTGDPDLGLKAGREIDAGAGGPLEYAIRSAATVADAIEVAARFMRLLSDAVDCRLEIDGERAVVRLDNKVPAPRAAADFQASALHTGHLKRHFRAIPGLAWSFPHEKPEDVSEYQRTFAPAALHFSAPFFGYSFDRAYLTTKRETGDPRLHALLRKHAEMLLNELPKYTNFRATVQGMLEEELEKSRPTAASVAERLGISQRTLSRRLEAEGTSFKDLLDGCRRTLALDYVTRSSFRLPEVVFLLGFSETATFYRAFKRWTGQTPLQYRKANRGEESRGEA
jgi:AraC-like DNA-binding protein